jgi:hypothetical protein
MFSNCLPRKVLSPVASCASHQVLVRPFATWAVRRAARRAAAARCRYLDSRAERDRSKIRTALCLFDWATHRGITLDQLCQADLDIWLTEHLTLAAPTRCFIAWTNRRGLTTARPDRAESVPRP